MYILTSFDLWLLLLLCKLLIMRWSSIVHFWYKPKVTSYGNPTPGENARKIQNSLIKPRPKDTPSNFSSSMTPRYMGDSHMAVNINAWLMLHSTMSYLDALSLAAVNMLMLVIQWYSSFYFYCRCKCLSRWLSFFVNQLPNWRSICHRISLTPHIYHFTWIYYTP